MEIWNKSTKQLGQKMNFLGLKMEILGIENEFLKKIMK